MNIVMIDNYDSFTFNLVHLVKEMGASVRVLRNDCFSLDELEPYDKIMLSPGPGIPSEAGLMPEVIRRYAGVKPILGICLGEQWWMPPRCPPASKPRRSARKGR